MARAPDNPSGPLFRTDSYIQSWWANAPYYASSGGSQYGYQAGNQFTNAAIRSGIVNPGGYLNVSPLGYGPVVSSGGVRQTGIKQDWRTVASPVNRNTPYDYLGNVKKQKGDIALGWVLMGPQAFPGGAFAPRYSPKLGERPNKLSMFMQDRGYGGTTFSTLRYRRSNVDLQSTGWQGNLTQFGGSNKALTTGAGGRGQSSEDSTQEMYSTDETRAGTRAQFTDETWNPEVNKIGRTWAGFKKLEDTGSNPFLQAELGRMYKEENTNTGFARRVEI